MGRVVDDGGGERRGDWGGEDAEVAEEEDLDEEDSEEYPWTRDLGGEKGFEEGGDGRSEGGFCMKCFGLRFQWGMNWFGKHEIEWENSGEREFRRIKTGKVGLRGGVWGWKVWLGLKAWFYYDGDDDDEGM